MLPVALAVVSQQPELPTPPTSALTAPTQPVFSTGAQANTLLAQAITPADAATVVTSTGNQIDITGGQASTDGANLFHSFEQFGLSAEQTANFVANPQVQTVLGRVQGGDASYINGLLRISNSDASLFLINPAGILFGQNASLDLNGSFTATTADRVGLDGGWLDVFEAGDYAQLLGDPKQFSFSASEPGSVVNLGNLAVGENQSLTLLGSNVVNTGSVSAPGGQATLAAVNGRQTVTIGSADGLLSMELTPFETSQEFSVLSLPELLTGGQLSESSELVLTTDGAVALKDVTIPRGTGTTAVAGSLNTAAQIGGELNLLGDRVALLGADLDTSGRAGGGTVRLGGGYQGDDAIPNADLTYISSDSTIDVSGGEIGDGGVAIAWADGLTSFYGSIDASGGNQSGNGGFVEVSGKNSLVFEGDVDLTAPHGTIGDLLLDPQNITITDGANGTGGNDNNPILAGPDVLLESDALPNNFEISRGKLESLTGSVSLSATNNITIDNISFASDDTLNLQAGSILFDAGNIFSMNADDTIRTNGGDITIAAGEIDIGNITTDGGDIALDGPVVLRDPFFNLGHTLTTGTGDGDITFTGTVDSENAITPVRLEVSAGAGDVVFEQAVGSINPLERLRLARNTGGFVLGGNNISLKDFSGNSLSIIADSAIVVDAVSDFTTDLFVSSRGGGDIDINTQGNLSLTSGIFDTFNTDSEIRLTAPNGAITLDDTSVSGGSGIISLQSQSIELFNNSSLTNSGGLALQTQGIGNTLTIRDSLLDTDGELQLSAIDGTLTIDNSQLLANGVPGNLRANARVIDVQSEATLDAQGALTLEATESILLEGSRLDSEQELTLLAQDAVQITDPLTPSVLTAGNNIRVQGDQLVNIQNIDQPQSVLLADGDIVLVSNNPVGGQGRFINRGDFSVLTLADTPGSFSYTPVSSDGIISSGGSVTFGAYIGSSLKVEAGGDITVDGDISITTPNTTLQGTDGEIAILSSVPALILRAGLAEFMPQSALPGAGERRNSANIPPDRTVGATTFVASDGSSAAGNITVGDIDTDEGPVILSAQGNIRTGRISTNGVSFGSDDFGGSVELSAGGDIVAETTVADQTLPASIDTDREDITLTAGGSISVGALDTGGLDANGSEVKLVAETGDIQVDYIDSGAGGIDIIAAGSFRAVDSFENFFQPNAVNDPELVDFLVAQGYDREAVLAGNVLLGDTTLQVSLLARPNSSLVPPGSLNAPITIRYGDAARTIADIEYTIEGTPSRILIQGDSQQAFVAGPSYETDQEFVPAIPGDNLEDFDPANPFPFTRGEGTAYTYPSEEFPEGASGLAAGIAVGEGTDSSLYGSLQNQLFEEVNDDDTVTDDTVTTVAEIPQSVEQIENDTSQDVCDENSENTVATAVLLSVDEEVVADGRSVTSSQAVPTCAANMDESTERL